MFCITHTPIIACLRKQNRSEMKCSALTLCFSVTSHLHPQTAQAVAGGEAGSLRCGDGVLLPPAAGLHQRAQPGGQLPGHGASPLLHQTLHAGRVCTRTGKQPQTHAAPAPASGEAQHSQDEGTR